MLCKSSHYFTLNPAPQWKSTMIVQAHRKSISCLEVLGDVVVTGSSESMIKVWHIKDGSYLIFTLRSDENNPNNKDVLEEAQSIPLRSKYPLSVDIATLPGSSGEIAHKIIVLHA